jgi:guanine deaminase
VSLAAFRAELLAVREDPASGSPITHFEDGLLVVEDGVVAACGAYADLADRFADTPITAFPGQMITPGFIDAHVHYPQTEIIAAHGGQLLDWLDQSVFPAETRFADRAHADSVASFFLDELLRNGTTSALVFATVHAQSVDALFEAALARDMRIVAGKVLMDRDAPDGLRDTVASGRADSEALIARWRGRGRLGYAVTPRFVLTSSDAQLASAAEMVAAHPDVRMHSHLAENAAEVAAVAGRFPAAKDYLDVFEQFGLVGPRSVFAHCIQLDDDAFGRLAGNGAHGVFCPTSNLFLGSGLFDLSAADRHGLSLGLGTDIGAGTSFSLLHTMGEAYKVCQLRGLSLDPYRALYLATVGGAKALGIADEVGGLAVGQEADFIVLDPQATPLLARRTQGASLHARLFALQILGDDRAVAATYVRGKAIHQREGAPSADRD